MKPNTDIVRRFKNEGRVESIAQKGQPKKLPDREEAEPKMQEYTNKIIANMPKRLNYSPKSNG